MNFFNEKGYLQKECPECNHELTEEYIENGTCPECKVDLLEIEGREEEDENYFYEEKEE